jgi:hypothetical protein
VRLRAGSSGRPPASACGAAAAAAAAERTRRRRSCGCWRRSRRACSTSSTPSTPPPPPGPASRGEGGWPPCTPAPSTPPAPAGGAAPPAARRGCRGSPCGGRRPRIAGRRLGLPGPVRPRRRSRPCGTRMGLWLEWRQFGAAAGCAMARPPWGSGCVAGPATASASPAPLPVAAGQRVCCARPSPGPLPRRACRRRARRSGNRSYKDSCHCGPAPTAGAGMGAGSNRECICSLILSSLTIRIGRAMQSCQHSTLRWYIHAHVSNSGINRGQGEASSLAAPSCSPHAPNVNNDDSAMQTPRLSSPLGTAGNGRRRHPHLEAARGAASRRC